MLTTPQETYLYDSVKIMYATKLFSIQRQIFFSKSWYSDGRSAFSVDWRDFHGKILDGFKQSSGLSNIVDKRKVCGWHIHPQRDKNNQLPLL